MEKTPASLTLYHPSKPTGFQQTTLPGTALHESESRQMIIDYYKFSYTGRA